MVTIQICTITQKQLNRRYDLVCLFAGWFFDRIADVWPCQDGVGVGVGGGGGAFARNFRDNFDETVCRGTSYRILMSLVQLPIILSSFKI